MDEQTDGRTDGIAVASAARALPFWRAVIIMALEKPGELIIFSPTLWPPCMIFTARRNAHIASTVLATAIPSVHLSVCLSVCHMPVLCQNDYM